METEPRFEGGSDSVPKIKQAEEKIFFGKYSMYILYFTCFLAFLTLNPNSTASFITILFKYHRQKTSSLCFPVMMAVLADHKP